MKELDSQLCEPLLIGGGSKTGCSLVGELINQFETYDCTIGSNLLCHPFVWSDKNFRFSERCESDSNSDNGVLTWALPKVNAAHFLYHAQLTFPEASSGSEFADDLFKNKVKISGKKQWAESSSENLYAANKFLEGTSSGNVLLILQDGRSRVPELIASGISPKAASKIWVLETLIILNVYSTYRDSGRVQIIRFEDFLSSCQFVTQQISGLIHVSEIKLKEQVSEFSNSRNFHTIRRKLFDQQSSFTQLHQYYLYGTKPKPNEMKKAFDVTLEMCGAELLYSLGYTEQVLSWDAISLPKEDQFLRDRKSRRLNQYADFGKPIPRADEILEQSRIPKWKFWRRTERKALERAQDKLNSSAPPEKLFTKPIEPLKQSDLEFGIKLPPREFEEQLDIAIVIAFLGRHEIVESTVKKLNEFCGSEINLRVFLACSEKEDFIFSKRLNSEIGIGVVTVENRPLGKKWQTVVDFAREFNPEYLAIIGSDDYISRGYLMKALSLMNGAGPVKPYDFIAPASWFIYDINQSSDKQGSLWELAYAKRGMTPLGAGRIYSASILDKMDWKLFDSDRDSGLDIFGYKQVVKNKGRTYSIASDDGVVLSVKGEWDALNSAEKILKAPNIQSRICDFEKVDFFSKHFDTDSNEFSASINKICDSN